jgi:hypothetical protein
VAGDEALERAATVLLRLGLLTVLASGPGWSAGTQDSFPYYCSAFLEGRVARGQRPRPPPPVGTHRRARDGDTPGGVSPCWGRGMTCWLGVDAVGLFHCNDAHATVHRFCAGSGRMAGAVPPQGEDDGRPDPLRPGHCPMCCSAARAAPTMPASLSSCAGTTRVRVDSSGTHLSAFLLTPPPTMIMSGQRLFSRVSR